MRVVLLATALFLPVLAGCLAGSSDDPAYDPQQGPLLKMDLPIHVVAVGFEEFDENRLMDQLDDPLGPFKMIRASTTGLVEWDRLQFNVQFMVHEAPPAFAEDLFAYASTIARQGEPTAFLATYDRDGRNRICPPPGLLDPVLGPAPCDAVTRIDAMKIEKWIAQHRAEYGLEFPGAGYSFFVLDSYTQGLLAPDEYHQYFIDDDTRVAPQDQRAWGGAYDFVFLDVSAAPSSWDYHPWFNYTNDGPLLYDEPDPPIWDLTSKMDTFYANLARNIQDAAEILWARKPIYPVEYAEHYVLPIHVWIDPRVHTHPESPLAKIEGADLPSWTEAQLIQQAFQEIVPWATVEVTVEFHYLPDDDPEMAQVLEDAKNRYDNAFVDFGIVKKYLRDDWDDYAPAVDGARVYPTFAFWLEYPSSGLYAYSDSDELGNSFGVFINMVDHILCLDPNPPVCLYKDYWPDEESFWRSWWNVLIIHELGHSFGLTHPHDTSGLDEKGFTTYKGNWIWDSTSTSMTYRHVIPRFDAFDRDFVARQITTLLAHRALTDPGAGGAARSAATDALGLLRDGAYADAVEAARETLTTAGQVVLDNPDVGEPGTPTTRTVETTFAGLGAVYLPVAGSPVAPPYLDPFWTAYAELPMEVAPDLYMARFPVEVPDDASALLFEYEEADAATHARWAASLAIQNADGDYVVGTYYNAHDKAFLLDLDRCADGCTGFLYAYSGIGVTYDVTLTPYFPA